MKDITIYGNLVVDTIIEPDKIITRMGGIKNVQRAFEHLDPNLNSAISPCSFGYANLFINKEDSLKQPGLVSLNECNVEPERILSRVSHIAYINNIVNFDFIRDISCSSILMTADICRPRKYYKDENLFHFIKTYINILFLAEEDEDDYKDIIKTGKMVVSHSENGSKIYFHNELWSEHKLENKLNHLNVIGAGDIFAASLIYFYYFKKLGIQVSQIKAHEETTNLLRKWNEEI